MALHETLQKQIVSALNSHYGGKYRFAMLPYHVKEQVLYTVTVNDNLVLQEWTETEIQFGGIDQIVSAVDSLLAGDKVFFDHEAVCQLLSAKFNGAKLAVTNVLDKGATLLIEMSYNGGQGAITGNLNKASLRKLCSDYGKTIETVIAESLVAAIFQD